MIVAHALTEPTVDDATMGIDLIATGADAIARVTADAAYETVACYAAAEMRDATVVVPPSKTARVSRRRPRSRARDRTITDVRTLGRHRWKQEAGYQLQARVENAFFRYTSILGDRLRARSRGGRVAESVVACTVLNQMPELGRPESYSIGRCLASGLESLTVSFESCTSACAGKARSRGTRCRDVIFETLFETLWVSNPIRPRSAASRNRVMRGPGVTQGAKRSQGARRPRD